MISRVFKSIATAALDIKLFLLSIKLQVQQIVKETAIRIRTGPAWARPNNKNRSLGKKYLKDLTPLEAFAQGRNAILRLGKEE